MKDPAVAKVAVPRLFDSMGLALTRHTVRGHEAWLSEGTSYALLDDLLIIANTPAQLRAALDADGDSRRPSPTPRRSGGDA